MTLSEWITEEQITMAEAARRFSVAHTTVARWCSGELFPGRASLIIVRNVTGGKVSPDDFMPNGASGSKAAPAAEASI